MHQHNQQHSTQPGTLHQAKLDYKAKRKQAGTLYQQQARQLQQGPSANPAEGTPRPTTTRTSAGGKRQHPATLHKRKNQWHNHRLTSA
jgi:hypothetical protein